MLSEESSKTILFNNAHKGKLSNTVEFFCVLFCFVLFWLTYVSLSFFASSTWQTGIDTGDFYGENIERISGLHSYSLGQVVIK